MRALLYFLFLLSGATALVYQVVWVRQQSLVFGGTHLAVSTVLAVFMGGLALGGWLIGRRADRWRRPLLVYGVLELGIALSALAVYGILRLYPTIYVPLARPVQDVPAALTALRFLLAALAMIVPTTLMGATLPVLARYARASGAGLAQHLSFLYALNTLGAVSGAVAAGFLLLPRFGATRTLLVAVAVNILVGLAALLVGRRPASALGRVETDEEAAATARAGTPGGRLVLAGIGISGFCALGYEVLWTRALGTTLGTSTYGFTVMLAAFLTGIGLGSEAFGGVMRRRERRQGAGSLVRLFAALQALIGLSALGVTWLLGDLSGRAAWLMSTLVDAGVPEFDARQITSFAAAFSYMVVPAFLMGAAFPLAGTIHVARRGRVSSAVGEVLAWNTVGAILGAMAAGFLLIRLWGIERSLVALSALNLALAAAVAAAASGQRTRRLAGAALAALVLALPVVLPADVRLWNVDLIAIYRNNQRSAFDSPADVRAALANTEILYFHEGANSTISVIKVKGGDQALLVNGKVVASTMEEDVQCQYLLGHLPMLLHPDPKNVFVLGLGTGMTLGAVSLHPGTERIVLAELEPAVVPAARTFAELNHGVLDDPRLEIAATDGRNWLLTTRDRFEVITADPVHPWTRGSAYLYTAEYYALAASRLLPGGVMLQWLPIYELSATDLATVVRTFRTAFPHTQVWLTHYDAHLVGSDRPLGIDAGLLEARLAHPPLRAALARVDMGSPADFVSFFHFGDRGAAAFASLGTVNTDDNLYLEFSAPRSTGVASRLAENVEALARFREKPDWDTPSPESDSRNLVAGGLYDRLHALFFRARYREPEFAALRARLRGVAADYAPARVLERIVARDTQRMPRPVARTLLQVLEADGRRTSLEITSVTMSTGRGRAALMFVDNAERTIYGETYLAADEDLLEARILAVSTDVLAALEAAATELTAKSGNGRPGGSALRERVRLVVRERLVATSRPGDSLPAED
ncbi:MAG: fused MFS/spermidine synthase [Krumholzibacteria bacterium]|nr:fused MFS/spermidine synthase [Candidatus Krumholzibacteria bacterium]